MKLKSHWVPPALFGALVLSLSVTLLAIGARSPYTHSNLNLAYAAGYDRTTQTIVGPPQPVQRTGSMAMSTSGDLVKQGQALFFGLECASCHGLKGEGGVYGPIIVGTNAATIGKKASEGPGGMTPFAGLTDEDLNALAAYLQVATAGSGK